MTTAVIKTVGSTVNYYVEVDGVEYKIVHDTWPATKWNPQGGERWRVLSSQGIHRYARECDEGKPTYKRVLAAVKAALVERRASELRAELDTLPLNQLDAVGVTLN